MEELRCLIANRNALETEPFVSIHESYTALQVTVDTLDRQCETLERQLTHQLISSDVEKANNNSGVTSTRSRRNSVAESRLREKVEKLQEQLNIKLQNEVESSDSQLKLLKEVTIIKEEKSKLENTQAELEQQISDNNITIQQLSKRLEESDSYASLTEKQYDGLKNEILLLTNENEALVKINTDLVSRLVGEKEKVADEMNRMNDEMEGLKKKNNMLHALVKRYEDEMKDPNRSTSLDDIDNNEMKKGPKWGAKISLPTMPRFIVSAHSADITCARYNLSQSQHDQIATSSSDSTVKLWDTNTGTLKSTFRGNHGHPMMSCDFNGNLVAGCSSDTTCRVWNTKTERMIHHLVGHQHKISCIRFVDAKSIVTGSADRSIKLWDIARNTYLQSLTFRHGSTPYTIDVMSGTMVSGHIDGGVRLWDIRTSDRVGDFPSLHNGGVTNVQFHPTKNGIISTLGRDGIIKIFDVRMNSKEKNEDSILSSSPVSTFCHLDFRITCNWAFSSFSPDGNYISAGSGMSGDLFIWNLITNKLQKKLCNQHKTGVVGVSWGKELFTSIDNRGTMILWA